LVQATAFAVAVVTVPSVAIVILVIVHTAELSLTPDPAAIPQ
jgi:hypothetical protein